jgi:hypothetical protein
MLHDPERHEPLNASDAWDAARAQACIASIVRDTEARFNPRQGWPTHPLDVEPGDDPRLTNPTLYAGTCGVLWALRHLRAQGAVTPGPGLPVDAAWLMQGTRAWLKDDADRERASFLMGETPIRLLEHAHGGQARVADRLAELIEGNMAHPARELMWGVSRHAAGGAVHAPAHRAGPLRRAVPPHRGRALVSARMGTGLRLPLLDAAALRPDQRLHGCRAWLRGHGACR